MLCARLLAMQDACEIKAQWEGCDGARVAESRRFIIAPPGHQPLNSLHFSLVDVPDLQVLPAEFPTLQDIWMGAGPVPELLHCLQICWPARAVLRLPSLAPLSPLFYWVLTV